MKPFHPPYNLTTKLNEEQMFISDTTMTLNKNQEDNDSEEPNTKILLLIYLEFFYIFSSLFSKSVNNNIYSKDEKRCFIH